MKTFIPFILVSMVVFGLGTRFIIPVITGQPLERVPLAMLRFCQMFFFAPLCVVLLFSGLGKLVHRKKANGHKHV